MCLSGLVSLLISFFNSVMDEAEILELKPGTPRPPAREVLSLWEGDFAPPSQGTRVSRTRHTL